MKRSNRFWGIILACVFVLGLFPVWEKGSARAAENTDWVECTYDARVYKNVYTAKDIWYDVSYVPSQGVYIGYFIPQKTYMGTVLQSVSASRTKEATKHTYYPGTGTDIGAT